MSEEAVVAQGAVVGEQSAPEAVEAPQVEAKPETTEAPKEDKFASKFAALSRKEKAIREQERQLQAQSQQLKQMQAELEKFKAQQQDESSSWKSKIKSQPLEALKEAGLTYEELSEMVLNEGNPTPQQLIARTKAELEQNYKAELEQLKASLREKEEREEKEKYQNAEQAFKVELKQFIDSNDKYELTRLNDAYDLAFDVVKEYYDQTKKVLSYEEAANYVEEHLEEKANEILKAKKLQAKFSQKQTTLQGKPTSAPTLSNQMSAEKPVNGTRKLSNEESLREAAKLIRWED